MAPNGRFKVRASPKYVRYFSKTIEVEFISDVLDAKTNLPFPDEAWADFIHEMHKESTGKTPSGKF